MDEAEGPNLLEGDSPEGVPEEEGADEEARDRFDEIAAAGLGHRGPRGEERGWGRRETEGSMNFSIVNVTILRSKMETHVQLGTSYLQTSQAIEEQPTGIE
jgi:hypothetical protein